MAANITIGSLVLSTDGKTLVGTLSGGSGLGYAITNANGLYPHGGTHDTYIMAGTTVGVVASTITITLATSFLTGETITLNVDVNNTITDSGGNTGANATNTTITNLSTVTGASTDIVTNLSKFNISGAITVQGGAYLGVDFNSLCASATDGENASLPVEVVINVTSGTVTVDVEGYYNNNPSGILLWSADGAATQNQQGSNTSWEYIKVATLTTTGKHILRFNAPINYYTRSLRLSGGTATILTTACPVALFADNVSGTTATTEVSKVKRFGTMKPSGSYINNNHPGFSFVAQITATGLDVVCYTSATGGSRLFALDSIDTPCPIADLQLLSIVSNVALNNSFQIQQLVAGLSSGVSHKVEMVDAEIGGWMALRAYNGSKLAASASATDTAISVPSVAQISAGDWLSIDNLQNEELVKVSSITGSGPYMLNLVAALTKDHAAGVAVRNPTPTTTPMISTATAPIFSGRLIAPGDSITHAEAITPDGTFPATGYIAYDIRASHAFMTAREAGFDFVHCATQGWTSGNVAADSLPTFSVSDVPIYISIHIGTNDFGSAETLIADYTTNYGTIISNYKAVCTSGATIFGQDIFSPTNKTVTSNQGGKTKADYNAAKDAAILAEQEVGFTITSENIGLTLNKISPNPDIPDSTHPSIDGTTSAGTGGGNIMAAALLGLLTTSDAISGAIGVRQHPWIPKRSLENLNLY